MRRGWFLFGLAGWLPLALLSGCNGASVISSGGTTLSGSGSSFTGKVVASGMPVIAASVQLYAAGASGNGSTGTALLSSTLTTDNSGSFTVPSGYPCTGSAENIYLIASGGNAGSGNAANPSLALMSALGSCAKLATGSVVTVNEATTVAGVAALAAFYSAGGNLGSTASNTTGLANAFANAGYLADVNAGTVPGNSAPSNVTEPVAKLNTLANAIAACAASESACTALLSAATPSSGSAPKNTLDAVFDILHNPANQVSAVYAVAAGNGTYSPTLAAAPPDWLLSAAISGGGMDYPTQLVIDANGEAWVANDNASVLSAFYPSGAAISANGYSGTAGESWSVAVAPSGNVWATSWQSPGNVNSGYGGLTEFSSNGTVLSGSSLLYPGGISWPIALAADTNGDLWIANSWTVNGSSVTLLNSSGTALSGSNGWGQGHLAMAVALAVDASHNAWVANQGNDTITRISSDGSSITNITCCDGPSGIATDQFGYVWATNYHGSSVSLISTSGSVKSSGITGGGIYFPQGIAVDGAGTAWITNVRANSLTELAGGGSTAFGSVLSPGSGYGTDASLLEPYSVAIDASGNLWVSNNGSNTLNEFFGVAVPVKTPQAGVPQTP